MMIPFAQATCAMAELFKVEEARDQLGQLYPMILGAVMVRVASTVDVKPPKRPKVNVQLNIYCCRPYVLLLILILFVYSLIWNNSSLEFYILLDFVLLGLRVLSLIIFIIMINCVYI